MLGDVFSTMIDCSCTITWDVYEEKKIAAYEILRPDLVRLIDKLNSGLIFGKDVHCEAIILTDIHLLIQWLDIISKKRDMEARLNTGIDLGNTHYMDFYCTECIKKSFACQGISVDTIMRLFQLYDLYYGETYQDGIGYMQIEGSGPTPPINRINIEN